MALVKCPECGNAVSTEAPACPSCGFPVAAKMATQSKPAQGHGTGGGTAILVAVLLVAGLFLADYSVDCGLESTGFVETAYLSRAHHTGTWTSFQILPGI